jgi:macrolide transport system ATP-binding/permease protein
VTFVAFKRPPLVCTNMIIVKNVTKNILGEPLFDKISLVLNSGDKVGLVGPNGAGKTTLMNIILGTVEEDGGSVKIEHERIAYVPQKLVYKEGDTIESFLSAPISKARVVLEKVGLGNTNEHFVVSKLSGGQKTRLALAKALLIAPTALFLDEPTNHLDTKGLVWLEKFIADFNGIVLIISHDRKLLDNSVTKIFEIDQVNHTFVEYHGGYSAYRIKKQKSLKKQEEEYQRHQNEKKRLEHRLTLKRQEATLYADPAKGKQIRAMEKRLEREIYDKEISRPKDYKKIRGMDLQGETVGSK